ncbi:hypothetical protein TVAG_227110 [Trichomonas vaginalis G3]|uniref:RING-type domain-containing protein n=2 Tax=Trichomonas vaginalis (strain ATCC PRA-98 / G3) TaxID=412133 RepID=A2FFV5_TRIV3|nr:nuclear-transcribed mRNA catabolic process, deadenylation-dependent decay [Trichomonas vaginalis G3]EAX96216.1 hypothetical protein TVAG_227110 [Trichomonas vaginalis G3]KAI5496651.1 nuclear-transcribed mRNA catabolic process, deadenylation-dependent decay [Trichomonas vaginalis G3]|eukprot:XP_001309146.1 hypothetical protein [Trichomonas vaginalis G3]
MSRHNNNNSREVKVCPLCISDLSASEYDFYPCPCGYQICSFCFERIISEFTKCCPLCRRPYDEDAVSRVGPQYRPVPVVRPPPEKKPEPSGFIISKKMVQIVGIPQRYLQTSLLIRRDYLGQYGVIKKIAIYSNEKIPFRKQILQGNSSVYVKFKSQYEANLCILSLNNFNLKGEQINASYALTEECSEALQNKNCSEKKTCLKVHKKNTPTKIQFTTEEVERKADRFINALRIDVPDHYQNYPKRSFGTSLFPPPRIIPPPNGNPHFLITNIFNSEDPTLLDLASFPDAIPLPLPVSQSRQLCSLIDGLGLDQR